MDLRIGKNIKCEPVKKSNKLLCLQVDDGAKGRQIVSGIANYYKPEELVGKKLIFVANLEARKLCGLMSEGMIIAAEDSEGNVKIPFVDDDIRQELRLR